jgi:hypothetical protein
VGARAGGAPSVTGQMHHEVLQNFFKILFNKGPRRESGFSSAVSPGAASGRSASTGPRTSGGGGDAGRGGVQAEAVGLRTGSVRDETL